MVTTAVDFTLEVETSFANDKPNPDVNNIPDDNYSEDFEMSDNEETFSDNMNQTEAPASVEDQDYESEEHLPGSVHHCTSNNDVEKQPDSNEDQDYDTEPEEFREPTTCEEPLINTSYGNLLQEDTQSDTVSFSQDMEEPGSVSELNMYNNDSSSLWDENHMPPEQEAMEDGVEGTQDPESVEDGIENPQQTVAGNLEFLDSPSDFYIENSHTPTDGHLDNLNFDDVPDSGAADTYAGFDDPPNVSMTDTIRPSSGVSENMGERHDRDEQLSRASSGYNSGHGSFVEDQDM